MKLALAASACFALLAVAGAAPSLAASGSESSAAANGSTCEGQVFTQPFALLGDLNSYLLVPGSQFSGSAEGWQLSGGAQVTESNRPYGLSGGVLELPYGAEAVSPPVCVTLQYPTGKTWVRRLSGDGSIKVSVSYVGAKSETKPREVEQLHPQGSAWTPEAFEVEPQLGGSSEGTREVRFVFYAHGGSRTDYQLYGVYVDPRML